MISVVIPVYKNTSFFLANLKKNLKFLKDCEIIIVNDYPKESIKKEIDEIKAKNIVLIENKKNLGFGPTVNVGAKRASGDYLLLLNSDTVLIDKGYLLALKHFKKNSNLFAVSFAQKERNNEIVGKNIIYFKDGLFHHQKVSDLTFGKNAWAEGGATLIDKKKFDLLNGFDPIYSPFYWEDVDLSYRAWKAGFEILFDPKILVEHHHQSTIGKYFSSKKIEAIAFRNQLIFTFKNISEGHFYLQFFIFFFKRFFQFLITANFYGIMSILGFLKRLPVILKTKIVQRNLYKVKDEEILAFFKVK
jgi:GT2 family glycosyltransferase